MTKGYRRKEQSCYLTQLDFYYIMGVSIYLFFLWFHDTSPMYSFIYVLVPLLIPRSHDFMALIQINVTVSFLSDIFLVFPTLTSFWRLLLDSYAVRHLLTLYILDSAFSPVCMETVILNNNQLKQGRYDTSWKKIQCMSFNLANFILRERCS